MSESTRLDIFQPGDRTALVCIDVPEMQQLVVEQLTGFDYKIHTGFSSEDLVLKLRTHSYDVVVISENFGGTGLENNPVLSEAVNAPVSLRHQQFVVLVGASFTTNDEVQAFLHGVDMVIGLSDVVHLRPMLRRGLARTQEFYGPYFEVLRNAGAA